MLQCEPKYELSSEDSPCGVTFSVALQRMVRPYTFTPRSGEAVESYGIEPPSQNLFFREPQDIKAGYDITLFTAIFRKLYGVHEEN